MFIDLCHPEVKLQLHGTAPSSHSENTAEETQQDTAPQLCLPPRAHELQAPGHQLDNSQVKIELFFKWAAMGNPFFPCMPLL